ncbi:MAG: hypothetical protein HQL84_04410 [Magnetococcales bacterium]|nr:hypothetical protein [Magnetococcales bacterium]MBF0149271.1 hypothetical protein [Magnetococcales bacterium]MBF0632179.1 hypothetical protein [Magnetococcales bacterium]
MGKKDVTVRNHGEKAGKKKWHGRCKYNIEGGIKGSVKVGAGQAEVN